MYYVWRCRRPSGEGSQPPAIARQTSEKGSSPHEYIASNFTHKSIDAMQKPTPASIEAQVADVQFYQWPGSTMITCKVTTLNGFETTANSKPIEAAAFTEGRGQDEARKKAVATLWDVEIYRYLQHLSGL